MPTNNWINKIFDWADEFEIAECDIPRDKNKLLAITTLDINRCAEGDKITYLPDEIGCLTNLTK